MTTTMWVYKENGTVQCHPEIDGISLEDMKQDLGKIAGLSNILSEEERDLPLMIPAACNYPTGRVNAYKLNETGAYMLFRGFVGPMGFKPWIWGSDSSDLLARGGDGDPFPYNRLLATVDEKELGIAFINIISAATTAGVQPNLISELKGRKSRYYKQGDMLSLDFSPARVNIEVDDKHIVQRVWFG